MPKYTFTPKSEDQFKQEEKDRQEQFLWDAGQYAFEITAAKGKTSKEKFTVDGDYISGGKPMIEMKVTLYKDDGKKQSIFDYLTFEGQFAFKFRHAAYACGLGADYEAGAIDPSDFEGKSGLAKVGVQKASGDYPARNTITDYVLDAASSAKASHAKTAKVSAADLDDEIPF